MMLSLAVALAVENSTEEQLGGADEALKQLSVFFGLVAAHPQQFPVTGRMATAIKDAKRQEKGPARKPPRLNARKLRQAKRQGSAKLRRKNRAEDVAAFNAAMEEVRAQQDELNRIQQEDQARLEALLEKDVLTPAELSQILALFQAPPVILEAAGKVRGKPEIILP
jgi:hypothetical protein